MAVQKDLKSVVVMVDKWVELSAAEKGYSTAGWRVGNLDSK